MKMPPKQIMASVLLVAIVREFDKRPDKAIRHINAKLRCSVPGLLASPPKPRPG
jgi:hypothetical protein